MNTDGCNIRFQCAFSRKGIRNNTIACTTFILLWVVFCVSVRVDSDDLWKCVIITLFVVMTSVYSLLYVYRLKTGSYLEITTDGIIKCVYIGSTVSYPVKEIVTVEEVTLKQAGKRFAISQVALNSRSWQLYPSSGVLITFNRAWLKSVFPVYFNPSDISGFISAVNKSREIYG